MTKSEANSAKTVTQTEIEELDDNELDQAQGAGLPINFAKNGIAAPSDQDLVTDGPDGSIGQGWMTAPVGV